jgi:outer membrane protein OmpA-like peptidoglycan-associated protein
MPAGRRRAAALATLLLVPVGAKALLAADPAILSAEEIYRRLLDSAQGGAGAAPGTLPGDAAEAASSLELPAITFAPGSAMLTAQARASLDAFVQALRASGMATRAFTVAGHTDARGDAARNRTLSEARARSVRAYLMERHGLAAEQVAAEGFGESRPKPGLKPDDSAQRRVEIHFGDAGRQEE